MDLHDEIVVTAGPFKAMADDVSAPAALVKRVDPVGLPELPAVAGPADLPGLPLEIEVVAALVGRAYFAPEATGYG